MLFNLLLKAIYTAGVETQSAIGDVLGLPPAVVDDLLDEAGSRQLVVMGGAGAVLTAQTRYVLTAAGVEWAQAALHQNQYVGPAPVPLADFCEQIGLQRISNERIDQAAIERVFGDLTISNEMVERLGPAINSGRSILLYGPPGNGKTSVAERVATLFRTVVYIPHCIEVGGQIIKVFDAAIHRPVEGQTGELSNRPTLHRENFDRRWEACWRPIVVTGGELNLEMLDIGFNADSGFYEAPLHVKALGGIFIIDDFGRQLVTPTILLNRWIVPMESRVEHLKLKSGKSFSLPFDELLIFSTNLSPSELMDAAFLRRLPYKIEIGAPTPDAWRDIFKKCAKSADVDVAHEIIDDIMADITERHSFKLAAYQPRFIIDQVRAACRFENRPARFDPHLIRLALSNMHTKDTPGFEAPRASVVRPPRPIGLAAVDAA
jgi:predicted ATPase with chaperone activity